MICYYSWGIDSLVTLAICKNLCVKTKFSQLSSFNGKLWKIDKNLKILYKYVFICSLHKYVFFTIR